MNDAKLKDLLHRIDASSNSSTVVPSAADIVARTSTLRRRRTAIRGASVIIAVTLLAFIHSLTTRHPEELAQKPSVPGPALSTPRDIAAQLRISAINVDLLESAERRTNLSRRLRALEPYAHPALVYAQRRELLSTILLQGAALEPPDRAALSYAAIANAYPGTGAAIVAEQRLLQNR